MSRRFDTSKTTNIHVSVVCSNQVIIEDFNLKVQLTVAKYLNPLQQLI